ncbi:FAD-dependent monooxygenase [Methylobacterium crusticola]|uniref:FAD-dependent monooxygenase n=1 Tax=Methylobacterium crusticola TaxID=1697972 RepID=UPI000FFB143A|nr:FAD-dependent monooxygenase [Methylobacterium crusticola]
MSADALVVGAGPVGLALAIGLSQRGLRVRVVDRKLGPTREPRAAVIWPRGAEVLDDLGLDGAIREAANALSVIHFHSRGRELGTARLGRLASRYPCPLLIEQHVTERLLVARLAALGIDVEWGTRADDLRCDDDGVTVRLRDPRGRVASARAAWVIGCDGAHSVVRERLGIPFVGGATANLLLQQVDAVPRWRHPACLTHGHYFLARGVCLGSFPVAEGAYRFFCYTDDPVPQRSGTPSAGEMQALIARVAGTPELRLDRVTWLSQTCFQTRYAARLRIGRVLLAGDAAHVWPSLGGHGMSLGLRGAHNLAWKLAAVQQGEAGEELLDTYEVEERHAVASFLRLMPYNVVERPSGPGGLRAREWLLRLGLRMPGLVSRIEQAVSDLDGHHRDSALSPRHQGLAARRDGVRAGGRLPDVEVTAGSGSVRLHALLAPIGWTLLAPTSVSAAAWHELRSTLTPWDGCVRLLRVGAATCARRRVVAEGVFILVRPDRHVGLLVQHHETAKLRTYLARWLSPALTGSRSRSQQIEAT